MDPKNAIEIDNVSKDFKIYHRSYGTLKSQTTHVLRRMLHREKIQAYSLKRALDHVNIAVPRGQSIALLGKNGSGKSTLLSLLTRIYLPTEGEIKIRGKVAGVLELGVGFNVELTGAENVFFASTIRGMDKETTAARYDSIVEFSELDHKTLSLPLRMYSSGMEARLAFSVAIHIDSDILLVDEALAVGDIAFQQKCLAKLEEFRSDGKTIFLVTHNLPFISDFADRAIWLHEGKVRCDGQAAETVAEYSDFMLSGSA